MNFQSLSDFLDMLADDMKIPYLDCIVKQDHHTLFRRVRGFADQETGVKATGNELFFLWSISKVMTSAAAMQLYERGKYLMDEPISRYIPAFADMQVRERHSDGTETLRPAAREIEIRDLFCMGSGLTYNMELPALKQLEKENPHFTTREFIEALASEALFSDPGTEFSYGLSMDVIAYLVEVISEMPFADYMKKYIFEPCGMERSTFDADAVRQQMIRRYDYSDADGCAHLSKEQTNILVRSDRYHSGGAGVISCVKDASAFADAMACGGVAETGARILTPGSINLMRQNLLDESRRADMNLPGYGYGYGVRTMINLAEGGGTGSLGEFGWSGAAGCYIMIDPDRHLSVFYGQNMFNNKEGYVHRRLRNLVYAGLEQ